MHITHAHHKRIRTNVQGPPPTLHTRRCPLRSLGSLSVFETTSLPEGRKANTAFESNIWESPVFKPNAKSRTFHNFPSFSLPLNSLRAGYLQLLLKVCELLENDVRAVNQRMSPWGGGGPLVSRKYSSLWSFQKKTFLHFEENQLLYPNYVLFTCLLIAYLIVFLKHNLKFFQIIFSTLKGKIK